MKEVGMIHRVTKEDLRKLKDFKHSEINQEKMYVDVTDTKENIKVLGKVFLIFGVIITVLFALTSDDPIDTALHTMFGVFIAHVIFAFILAIFGGETEPYSNQSWIDNDDTTDICSDPTYDSFYCNDFYDVYSDSSFSSLPGNEYHID